MEMITFTKLSDEDELRYGLLTDTEIEELDNGLGKNHLIISHVGDGEYMYNTFGNVFSSFTEVLKSYKIYCNTKLYGLSKEYLISIFVKYRENANPVYYVGYIHEGHKQANVWPQLIGFLSVEDLNGEFRCGN